jgi:hypothetical protein
MVTTFQNGLSQPEQLLRWSNADFYTGKCIVVPPRFQSYTLQPIAERQNRR